MPAASRCPLASYLKVFRQRRAELWPAASRWPTRALWMRRTPLPWISSAMTEPAAVELLELCALLAPDEIPVLWLLEQPDLLPEPVGRGRPRPTSPQ